MSAPIQLSTFLPQVSAVLQDMLGVSVAPVLTLAVLDEGKRRRATTDVLRDRSSEGFLVSIQGELETISLRADAEFVRIVMGAQRTRLEYALGAAAAIAAARLSDGVIEDGWKFFSPTPEIHCEELLATLRAQATLKGENNLREASERLVAGEPLND
jgi:hypothetical protein